MCNKVKNAGFCEEDILDLGLAQKCNATCGKCGKFRGQCINACIIFKQCKNSIMCI